MGRQSFTDMAAATSDSAAPSVGVGMLGYSFMGKAHSNALKKLPYMIYPPPAVPELVAICGRDEAAVAEAARRYGYARYTTDWRDLIDDERVQLFDNGGPNDAHAEPCIAAAAAAMDAGEEMDHAVATFEQRPPVVLRGDGADGRETGTGRPRRRDHLDGPGPQVGHHPPADKAGGTGDQHPLHQAGMLLRCDRICSMKCSPAPRTCCSMTATAASPSCAAIAAISARCCSSTARRRLSETGKPRLIVAARVRGQDGYDADHRSCCGRPGPARRRARDR